jgi:hypothetical protein
VDTTISEESVEGTLGIIRLFHLWLVVRRSRPFLKGTKHLDKDKRLIWINRTELDDLLPAPNSLVADLASFAAVPSLGCLLT